MTSTNLSTVAKAAAATTERTNLPPKSSPSTRNMVVAAISGGATIPTNPSTVLTAGTAVTAIPKADDHVYNTTGYLVEHDELDHSILAGFSDIQTVFLACIATLLPLIVALGIAFCVRYIWRKFRHRRDNSNGLPWYRSICSRDNIVDSLHHHPHSGSTTIQPATRILSAKDLVDGIDGHRYICEADVMEEIKVATASPVEYMSPGNHTNKNANGNIITLTLKNNHIIVETEERGITVESGGAGNKNRKYEDNEYSFVMEVPGCQNEQADVNKGSFDDMTGNVTDQRALVHREEIFDDRDEMYADKTSDIESKRLFGSTNTGLSQSDLSISNQGSVNPSYRYGSQVEYHAGHLGYPLYGGSYEYEILSSPDQAASSAASGANVSGGGSRMEIPAMPDQVAQFENSTPGKITSGDTKISPSPRKVQTNETKNADGEMGIDETQPNQAKPRSLEAFQESGGSSMEHQDSTDASNSTDTVRSNPNLQVNGATPNKLEIMEQKALSNDFGRATDSNRPVITGALLKDDAQEDTFQEQQRKLGNGTLTPEHKEIPVKEQKPEGSAFVPCHKRTGSIPPRLIEESLELDRKKPLDIYSQIKASTKSIIPGLSAKFELLQNEVSPIEEKES